MLAEFVREVFNRLDTRFEPEIVTLQDPDTDAEWWGYFKADGSFVKLHQTKADPVWPNVALHSLPSLVSYIKHHGFNDESVVLANKHGFSFIRDFGYAHVPLGRGNVVTLPAVYHESCEQAGRAIEGAIGKWITLEQFDHLIDTCAPFIANFAAIEEATQNITGSESAKVVRTSSGFQVQVTGEVACTATIPKDVRMHLLFMNEPISVNVPLRLTVKDKQVQFHLVDNGALAKAKHEVVSALLESLRAEFKTLLIVEGRI